MCVNHSLECATYPPRQCQAAESSVPCINCVRKARPLFGIANALMQVRSVNTRRKSDIILYHVTEVKLHWLGRSEGSIWNVLGLLNTLSCCNIPARTDDDEGGMMSKGGCSVLFSLPAIPTDPKIHLPCRCPIACISLCLWRRDLEIVMQSFTSRVSHLVDKASHYSESKRVVLLLRFCSAQEDTHCAKVGEWIDWTLNMISEDVDPLSGSPNSDKIIPERRLTSSVQPASSMNARTVCCLPVKKVKCPTLCQRFEALLSQPSSAGV